MTVPEALQDRRLRRFPLRRVRLPMARGTLSMVVPRASDPSFWPQTLQHFEREGRLPYWAEIWPAAVAVARVLSRSADLAGSRVLDLGCGLGLAGSAAARCGADVLFVDRDPDALQFARFNGQQNAAAGARIEVLQLDWNDGVVPAGFDLVLLADVSYEPRHRAPLLAQLAAALGAGGHALHADPYREESTAFLEMVARHYGVESVATDTHFQGRRSRVRLSWIRPVCSGELR